MKITTAVKITNIDESTRLISYDTIRIIESRNSKDILSNLITTKYMPVKGDKIWFYPGCTIPRFKVKQFCQAANVAVVKYKEKASIRFIGPESFEQMIESISNRYVNKDMFLRWLDSIMCNEYEQLKKDIINTTDDKVYIKHKALFKFCDSSLFMKKVIAQYPSDVNMSFYNIINTEENYQQLICMHSDTGLRHQDDFLSLLNTGTVLDEDMYTQIHRLLESTDKENTRLAMEAMANCDFRQSAVYLLLLLKKFGQKMEDSRSKHYVNFKSMIKYFDVRSLNNITTDGIINSLRHQKLLSQDNLNLLMPLILQTIKISCDMQNVVIKDIELSAECEKSVAKNILDQTMINDPKIVQSNDRPTSTPKSDPNSHKMLFAITAELDLGFI